MHPKEALSPSRPSVQTLPGLHCQHFLSTAQLRSEHEYSSPGCSSITWFSAYAKSRVAWAVREGRGAKVNIWCGGLNQWGNRSGDGKGRDVTDVNSISAPACKMSSWEEGCTGSEENTQSWPEERLRGSPAHSAIRPLSGWKAEWRGIQGSCIFALRQLKATWETMQNDSLYWRVVLMCTYSMLRAHLVFVVVYPV